MIFLSVCALMPFILLFIASFTDNTTAMVNGYSFFPEKWSLDAYQYITREWRTVGQAYIMTILVTVIGTAGSLAITSMFAYAISNRNLPGRKLLSFMSIFTMLFNGGIVSSYYVYSSVFQIKNTIWALIIPNLLMNAFTVMLVRNYFANSVSPSITEAARIDGAGEFRIFAHIMLPLSVPILATIGLMGAIAYWNDWTNGLYFLANNSQITASAGRMELPSTTIRMAIAVIGILPIILAYPFFQKYFIKGIALGGVKE
jgi:putative aldouronate transport system permease protein